MIVPDMKNAVTNTVPVSRFNRGLAGKVFEDVKRSGAKVVIKYNTPVCVLLSPDEYVKLMDEVNDYRLLSLADERMVNFDASNVIPEEEVLKELVITAGELADAEKAEIE